MMPPTLIWIMILVMATISNNVVAFHFRVKRSSSSGVLKYKKESNDNKEHHPHLKQGENVLESTINRVLREDIDCPLLKHRELMSSSPSSSTREGQDIRTVIVPSTIDSLPPELVDMTEFKNDMKVQARMRVPSFNALGYKASLIRDLKHQKIPSEQAANIRAMGQHEVALSESNGVSIARGRSKAVVAHLWLQLNKAFTTMTRKSRHLALRLAKADWSPILQWVVLIFALHAMCYHGIPTSSLGFRLL